MLVEVVDAEFFIVSQNDFLQMFIVEPSKNEIKLSAGVLDIVEVGKLCHAEVGVQQQDAFAGCPGFFKMFPAFKADIFLVSLETRYDITGAAQCFKKGHAEQGKALLDNRLLLLFGIFFSEGKVDVG